MEPKFFQLPVCVGDVTLRVARGHFATRHSHINYLIDVTAQKSSLREAEAVAARFPDRMFWQVRGNGDFALGSADLLYAREETLGGKRLFFTHGHLYGVKTGLYRVCCAARERQADILLFGHTHQPLTDYDDGLYILNPGSLRGRGTYGLLDVTPTGVLLNVVENRR